MNTEHPDDPHATEEEFRTRVSNVSPAAPLSREKPTLDRLMGDIFPMMNEIMKDLSEDRVPDNLPSKATRGEESETESVGVELRETGKLVRGIAALFVGVCIWLLGVTGVKNIAFLRPLYSLVRMVEEQIAEGDCDSEFVRIDEYLGYTNVYLRGFIEGFAWILNKMIDHRTLLTFVLGFLIRGLLSQNYGP